MKSYRFFSIGTCILFIVYVVASLNKPQPFNWNLTLKKNDKNPLGAYILFNQLKNCFPKATIESFREPVYNRLHNNEASNTAYILVGPSLNLSDLDVKELCSFVHKGNAVLLSSLDFSNNLLDTLGISLKDEEYIQFQKTSIRFVKTATNDTSSFSFGEKLESHEYFDSIKNIKASTILGVNHKKLPNVIQIRMGKGIFLVHASPFVFSNYFLLHQNNAQYTSTLLHFLPKKINNIYWDEYAKLGREGAQTPLRFFLDNSILRWVVWLAIIGLLLYVFFNGKRTQRIIPVIEPLSNSTLDFVQTIAGLYFNQKDNNTIAKKRIQFWLDFIRHRFNINTENLDDTFIALLAKKSGVSFNQIQLIIQNAATINKSKISNASLLLLTKQIDDFYTQVK